MAVAMAQVVGNGKAKYRDNQLARAFAASIQS